MKQIPFLTLQNAADYIHTVIQTDINKRYPFEVRCGNAQYMAEFMAAEQAKMMLRGLSYKVRG